VRPALSALVLCALVVLGACGSGDPSSEKSEPGKAASPSAAYFTLADTNAINEAAAPAQAAGAKAIAPARMAACNKLKDYPAWRACWHGLLDPFARGLTGLSAGFNALAAKDLPEDCVTELERAAKTFDGFARRVEGLLAGVDSDNAAAQAKAAKKYSPTVTGIQSGFAKPFQAATQVCYSPKDLASINASPSPSN
jgi:hypothetical protein